MIDEELILQNIEEFVKDENKIVSYAWLSSNLDIDVDKAKFLVENYAIKNGLIKPGLEVTYLLAGTLETTGEYIVEVVRQCDLEKVTAQFKEIQSEHIYSVQKEFILKDSTLQSFFDDQIIFDSKRQGLIEYLEALPLSPEEMTVLREKSFTTTKTKDDKQYLSQTQKEAQNILPKVLEQSTLKIVKDAHDGISAIDKNEITTKRDSFNTPGESKEEDVALFTNLGSQKVKHGQGNMQDKLKKISHSKHSYKGNIASYFSCPKEKSPANSSPESLNHAIMDANSKSVEPKVESSSSLSHWSSEICDQGINKDIIVSTLEENHDIKGNAIEIKIKEPEKNNAVNLNSKPSQGKVNEGFKLTKLSKKKRRITELDSDTDNNEGNKNHMKIQQQIKKNKSLTESRGNPFKGSKLSNSSQKKRRRIITPDTSSDSDEDSDSEMLEEHEDPIVGIPCLLNTELPEQDIVSKENKSSESYQNMKCTQMRKLVDNTYTDADGFLCTRKEYVCETIEEMEYDDGKESRIDLKIQKMSDLEDLQLKEKQDNIVSEIKENNTENKQKFGLNCSEFQDIKAKSGLIINMETDVSNDIKKKNFEEVKQIKSNTLNTNTSETGGTYVKADNNEDGNIDVKTKLGEVGIDNNPVNPNKHDAKKDVSDDVKCIMTKEEKCESNTIKFKEKKESEEKEGKSRKTNQQQNSSISVKVNMTQVQEQTTGKKIRSKGKPNADTAKNIKNEEKPNETIVKEIRSQEKPKAKIVKEIKSKEKPNAKTVKEIKNKEEPIAVDKEESVCKKQNKNENINKAGKNEKENSKIKQKEKTKDKKIPARKTVHDAKENSQKSPRKATQPSILSFFKKQ